MAIDTTHHLKQTFSMLRLTIKKLVFLLLVFLSVENSAKAETENRRNMSWGLCQNAIEQLMPKNNVPSKLLTALSISNAGRWNTSKQETIAWPWTFNINGLKFFFDTKKRAVSEVRALRGEGWRNILVGCLQINIDKHGSAFFDLNEAFDPRLNSHYTANYLENIYKKDLGWIVAIKEYSPKQFLQNPDYIKKIKHLWLKNEKQKTIYVSHSLQSIDHSRTMLLNQRLREKRKNAREKNTKSGLSNLRKSQIEAWRTNRSRPEALAQVLAIRIAENAKRRQKKLKKFYHQENKLSFTEKRHNELLSWRKKLTPSPNK